MVEIDPVILQLRAELDSYTAKLRVVTNQTERQLKQQERAVQRLEAQFKSSSSAIAVAAGSIGGVLAGAFSVTQAKELIDAYTRIQNQLRLTGLEGEALAATQNKLRTSANRYGVDLETLSQLYGRASQASSELGISQEQLLVFTNRIAASSKVAGTSIESQKGALLQLAQALQSGTVRAEEYNSINEGLFPVLQAVAAGSDRFGGSIAKLRAAVIDGTVSSREFFNAFIAGSETMEGKAANAVLTLSGAFTVLHNELINYVGEASATNGVTAALSEGVVALSRNLDTLVEVLAVIAVVGLGRFVAGTVGAGVALRTLAAYASIATTSLAGTALAAQGAGAALLAAVGGPVGAAVIALTVGIGYLATRETEAERAAKALATGHATAEAATKGLTDATDKLASAHGKAREEALALARAERENVKQKLASARASLVLAQAESARALASLKATQATNSRTVSGAGGGPDRLVYQGGMAKDRLDASKTREKQLEGEIAGLSAALAKVDAAIAGASAPAVGAVSSGKKTKAGKTTKGAGATGPSAADIEDRFNSQLTALAQQTLSARQRIATSAQEQAELELRNVELARIRSLEEIKGAKEFSAVQKARLTQQVEKLVEAEREAIEFQKQARLEQESRDIAQERYNGEAEALRVQSDLADSQKERRDIALKLVDLEYQYQKSLLEGVIASQQATDADKARAQIALDALNAQRSGKEEQARRGTDTPAQQFLREINKSSDAMNEDLQRVSISGLNSLNDGIVDAIMGAKSLGEVFKGVANQIIADLLRIAIQQALIKPLAESLFGGSGGAGDGGGGGLFSKGFSIFSSVFGGGRASGGAVEVGRMYRVNEANQEFFQPLTPGAVRTPQQAKAASSSAQSQPSVVKLYVDEGAMFAPRVEQISGQVSVEVVRAAAPTIRDAAVDATFQRGQRQTIR